MAIRKILIVLALLASSPALAQVYKWTDENGRVHFSDKPRSGGTSEAVQIEVTPPGSPPPAEAEDAAVAPEATWPGKAKQPLDVVMYATKTCGYCAKARAFFNQRGIAWQEIDIESSRAANEEFKSKGGQGVPLFFINGQRMRGFSEDRMQAFLSQYGY